MVFLGQVSRDLVELYLRKSAVFLSYSCSFVSIRGLSEVSAGAKCCFRDESCSLLVTVLFFGCRDGSRADRVASAGRSHG